MKPALRQQLQRFEMRLAELDASLADPECHLRHPALSRHESGAGRGGHLVNARRYEQREADLASARLMLDDPATDAEMAEMAREEITGAQADLARLLAELQRIDAHATRTTPATRSSRSVPAPGARVALFAADLARLYLRFCERQGWRTGVMSENPSDLGGRNWCCASRAMGCMGS